MGVANPTSYLDRLRHGVHRRWTRTALAVVGLLVTSLAVFPVQGAGASTLTSSDGNTTLSTIGTVTPGTPYTSGQTITVVVTANNVLS
jgi:hypothetical protein